MLTDHGPGPVICWQDGFCVLIVLIPLDLWLKLGNERAHDPLKKAIHIPFNLSFCETLLGAAKGGKPLGLWNDQLLRNYLHGTSWHHLLVSLHQADALHRHGRWVEKLRSQWQWSRWTKKSTHETTINQYQPASCITKWQAAFYEACSHVSQYQPYDWVIR